MTHVPKYPPDYDLKIHKRAISHGADITYPTGFVAGQKSPTFLSNALLMALTATCTPRAGFSLFFLKVSLFHTPEWYRPCPKNILQCER